MYKRDRVVTFTPHQRIASSINITSNSDINLSVIKLNMKQKIVMKVHMCCQKCRTKALKLVASANGVSFVGLEGDEREKVVVIGEGVDAVKLTNCLRKKVGHTEILSVAAA
ncbi:hypothetical protein K1719_041942 [Acacia pycnantha]|nr:hypothetical protein K1719_041942 [Acacia pycnantha]